MPLKARFTPITPGLAEFTVDSPAFIGRHEPGEPIPLPNPRTHQAIEIADPTNCVSQRHALVLPPKDLHGPFTISDLNSTNGTYVCGKRIPSYQHVELSRGDEVSFSRRASYHFSTFIDQVRRTQQALLVGHDGLNLRGVNDDICGMQAALEQRGFVGNIQTLINATATRANIFQALERVKDRSEADGNFVFHFSGHANQKGALNIHPEKIEADELMGMLKQIRGRLLIVLDGCYTNAVSEAGIPRRSVMIGHTTPAYEGRATKLDTDPFFGEIKRGYTTQAILRALQNNPGRISLDQIIMELTQDERINAHQGLGFHRSTNMGLDPVSSRRSV